MSLQWRMHQFIYALYFVRYDCIFPKYILSYLILHQLLVKAAENTTACVLAPPTVWVQVCGYRGIQFCHVFTSITSQSKREYSSRCIGIPHCVSLSLSLSLHLSLSLFSLSSLSTKCLKGLKSRKSLFVSKF